jgi:hypothetical protein
MDQARWATETYRVDGRAPEPSANEADDQDDG